MANMTLRDSRTDSMKGRLFRPVLAFVLVFLPLAAHSAPEAELWARWAAHDEHSTATVDHSAWNRLLEQFVSAGADGVNRFAYGSVGAAERAELDAYIDSLVRQSVSRLDRPEQEALWINLYNALTVRVVLDHYPVTTIRDIDISPGWFSNGPWGAKLITVEGEEISLDDIEHRILRPIWQDARLHYVLNCAAVGCPQLAASAYTPASLDAQLDKAARAFINHPRGVMPVRRGIMLSSIFDWYSEDFGRNDDELRAHLASFAAPELAALLAEAPRIVDYEYDWALNDAMLPTLSH